VKVSSNKSIVIQVVDSGIRDILWRLLLSVELANEGITSVIGTGVRFSDWINSSNNTLIFGRLPRNKGCSGLGDPILNMIRKGNSNLYYLHDEGGYYSKSIYKGSVSRSHILQCASHPSVKKIFFWGHLQERIAKSVAPLVKNKFVIIGAPRFDLYHKPYSDISNYLNDIDETNIKLEKYILICTRGGSINNSSSHPLPISKKARDNIKYGLSSDKEVERIMFGKWAKHSIDSVLMIKAISRLLIRFPDELFVIRPHPGEGKSLYEDAFDEYENVKIINNEDLAVAINSSKFIIANECTSGLEAIMAGREFINFRPSSCFLDEYAVHGLSRLGQIATDESSLIDLVDFNLRSQLKSSKLHSQRHIVKNLYAASIPTIVDEVTDYCNKSEDIKSYVLLNGTIKYKIYNQVRRILGRESVKYRDLKLPNNYIAMLLTYICKNNFVKKNIDISYKDGAVIVSPK
jgi:surface carbohydrate biosynthesis protein